MTLLQHKIINGGHLGDQKGRNTHQSFIVTKTVANVLETVKFRKLVDLPVTATIEQAFDLFLTKKIFSAPVYQLDNNEKKLYFTILSVLDLLKLSNQRTTDVTNRNQIKQVIKQTEESSKLVTVKYSYALMDVIHLFTKHGAHRVLLTGNQIEQPPVFLGQMDIMRYLQAHNHHLGAILDRRVPDLVQRSLQLRQKQFNLDHVPELATVTYKTTAIKAFDKISHDPFINSLPIVDDNNYLVGEISKKYLCGLNKNQLEDLFKPVLIFLQLNHVDRIAPITCHHRFTLSQIMAAFVLRKTPHLWWIDQEGHIQGTVTLTNILEIYSDDS